MPIHVAITRRVKPGCEAEFQAALREFFQASFAHSGVLGATMWTHRQLHGLEAWFRSPHNPPPKWKMAVATFIGVFPLAMVLNLTLGPIVSKWHSSCATPCSTPSWSRCSPGSLCPLSRDC